MKVQELIELLQHFDPELEVYAEFFNFYRYAPVSDVQTMTLTDEDIKMEEGFDTKQVLVITF
jgi:hypothetical protein